MKKIKKILINSIIFIILFITIYFVTTSSVENISLDIMIHNFTKKGELRSDLSSDFLRVYEVKGNETKSTYIKKYGVIYPGNKGDILVSRKSMVGDPIIRGFISFFAGGHACLCTGNYNDYNLDKDITIDDSKVIETTAFKGNAQALIYDRSYLTDDSYFSEIIGLRVKMTDDECDEVLSNAYSYINDPYNFSFIFNTNEKKYCSDLVSKSFKSIGKNLNKDGFTTSIYDLAMSNDTYISYYHYYKDEIKYIYFLS